MEIAVGTGSSQLSKRSILFAQLFTPGCEAVIKRPSKQRNIKSSEGFISLQKIKFLFLEGKYIRVGGKNFSIGKIQAQASYNLINRIPKILYFSFSRYYISPCLPARNPRSSKKIPCGLCCQ